MRGLVQSVAALLALAVAGVSPAGASAPGVWSSSHRATLRTFAGTWYGHTRILTISRKGRAKESIGDGCCNPVIDLKLRLSHPRGTSRRASIRARVIAVHVRDKNSFSKKHPPPHVGETRRLRLKNGVIHERITGTTYCDSRAARKGICGA